MPTCHLVRAYLYALLVVLHHDPALAPVLYFGLAIIALRESTDSRPGT